MKKYIGLISEVSDVVFKNQSDVDFYVSVAKKYKGGILELGSGSGHISSGLAKEGYDVTCLEIQRDMILLHEKKLDEDTRENTKIILADMCHFDLKKKFNLIIAPNNVISYLMTPLNFMEMLTSVKHHLSEQGVFVIEAMQANVERMKASQEVEVVEHYTSSQNNKIEERTTPNYNFDTQVVNLSKVITEYEDDKIKRRVEYCHQEKFWFEDQIKKMVKEAGLSVMLKSGNLNHVEPISSESSHMIFYINKLS